MAKKYIAIGLDQDGDVVATEYGQDSAEMATQGLIDSYDRMKVYHVIEIGLPDNKQSIKPVVTKLKIS